MNSPLKKAQSHHPRQFSGFKYVYPVISRRSGGLSIGINLNPDKNCNFDCPYCQVDRSHMPKRIKVELSQLQMELENILNTLNAKGVCMLEKYRDIAPQNKILKDIALSGDGEPTMAPEFLDVCKLLAKIQETSNIPFKTVLITNGTLLRKKSVQEGVALLSNKNGDVWVKLDAGTEGYYQKVNVSKVSLKTIVENIIHLGQKFPITIQTLFFKIDGTGPSEEELNQYVSRLQEIKKAGVTIKEVQFHSIARKPSQSNCTALDLVQLEAVAQRVLIDCKLKAKVYS